MVLLVLAVPVLIFLLCQFLGAVFGQRFPPRWWMIRLAIVPAASVALSVYVMVTRTPVPVDYDPSIHGNPGRMDFAAIMIYGFALPAIYLIAAFPVALTYAIWMRRK